MQPLKRGFVEFQILAVKGRDTSPALAKARPFGRPYLTLVSYYQVFLS
jgi:hypothetical protein